MTPSRMQEIVDALRGTCDTAESCLTPEECEEGDPFDSREFCEILDDTIFKCETCDWWCEVGESDDNGNCRDCGEVEE